MDEAMKISLQTLVHPLDLGIRLGMTGRTDTERDASQSEEFLPQVACEHTVAVGDDRSWQTVKFVDVFHEHLGH